MRSKTETLAPTFGFWPTVRLANGPRSIRVPGETLVEEPVTAWEIVDSAVVAAPAPLVICCVVSAAAMISPTLKLLLRRSL